MSYPLHYLEDTPNWEVGLRVHEAENRWLIREFDAVLRAYGALDYAQIAELTGVKIGTVRSRLSRARESVKSRLGWSTSSARNARNRHALEQ